MKELIIKWFFKHKAVKILLVDEAGHITTHWAIPEKDNTVKLHGVEKALVITKESMLISTKKNVPTFLVNYQNCESLNVKDVTKVKYGVDEFRTILDNDMAYKVFKSSQKGGISEDVKIIVAVIAVGILALGYFLNTKLTEIKSIVTPETPIVEVVEEVDLND